MARRCVVALVPGLLATMSCLADNTAAAPLVITIDTGIIVPAPLEQSTLAASVLDGEALDGLQARSIAEAIRTLPATHIDRSSQSGSVSSLYLRGADPNYTVVLIDGVKVNDPTNTRGGSVDFSSLWLANVEEVELVRGPLSAVYGTDAMAGAVNMQTRRGRGSPSLGLQAEGGDDGSRRALASFGGGREQGDYFVAAYREYGGKPLPESGSNIGGINGNFGRQWGTTQARLTLHRSDSEHQGFPDDSGGPRWAVLRGVDRRDVHQSVLGVHLQREPPTGWATKVMLGLYERDEFLQSPGVAPGTRDPFGIPAQQSDSDFRRYEGSLRGTFRTATARRSIGVEYTDEDGGADAALELGGPPTMTSFNLERRLLSVYAEVQERIAERLTVVAGVRRDKPGGAESGRTSPRIGAAYTVSTQTTLRAAWGESFKLPSFYALGNPIVGNPGLKPEEGRSVEIGWTRSLSSMTGRLEATAFHSTYSNAIDFDPGPPPQLVNRRTVVNRGVEMALHARPARTVSLRINASYVDHDILGTDQELRNRPRWLGGLLLHWTGGRYQANAQGVYVGKSLDSSVPTGNQNLSAYTIVNVSARMAVSSRHVVHLAADNLFDEMYETMIGFPGPGRTWRLGVTATL